MRFALYRGVGGTRLGPWNMESSRVPPPLEDARHVCMFSWLVTDQFTPWRAVLQPGQLPRAERGWDWVAPSWKPRPTAASAHAGRLPIKPPRSPPRDRRLLTRTERGLLRIILSDADQSPRTNEWRLPQASSGSIMLIADAGPCQGNKKKWLWIIVLFHYSKAFLRLKLLAFWMLRRNRFSNQLEQRAFDVIKSSRTGFICRATSAKNKRHAIASKWIEKPARVFLG
jgi:hypothetical protein